MFRSDVDFFVRKRTLVKEMESQEDDFYPPRFEVFLASSSKNLTLSDGSIRFKGADCDLQYDMYLDLPDQDTGPSASPPRMFSSVKSDVKYVKLCFMQVLHHYHWFLEPS